MNKFHVDITLDSSRIIPRIHEFFSDMDFAEELLQNARRSEATEVVVTIHPDVLIVEDNGRGIHDSKVITTIGRSNWTPSVMDHEGPAGMGIFSVLAAYESCVVRSQDWELTVEKSSTAELVTDLEPIRGTRVTARKPILPRTDVGETFAAAAQCKHFSVTIIEANEPPQVHGNFRPDKDADWRIHTHFGAVSLYTSQNPKAPSQHTFGSVLITQGRMYKLLFEPQYPTVREPFPKYVPGFSLVIEAQAGMVDLVLPSRTSYINNDKSCSLFREATETLWTFCKSRVLADGADSNVMMTVMFFIDPQRFRKETPESLFPKFWKHLSINRKDLVPLFGGGLTFTIEPGIELDAGQSATNAWLEDRGWTYCTSVRSRNLHHAAITVRHFAEAFPEMVWDADVRVRQDPRGKHLYIAEEILLTNQAKESKQVPLGEFSTTAYDPRKFDVVVVHTFPEGEVPLPFFEHQDFFDDDMAEEHIMYYQEVLNTCSSSPAPQVEDSFLSWVLKKFFADAVFPVRMTIKITGQHSGFSLSPENAVLKVQSQNRHRTIRLAAPKDSIDFDVVTDSGWSEFPKR